MSRTCRRLIEWLWVGPRRLEQGLTRFAPKSWKSASLQKVSKNTGMDWGGSVSVCACAFSLCKTRHMASSLEKLRCIIFPRVSFTPTPK